MQGLELSSCSGEAEPEPPQCTECRCWPTQQLKVTECKEEGAERLFWEHFTALGTFSAPLEQRQVQVLLLCRDSAPGAPDAARPWGGGC